MAFDPQVVVSSTGSITASTSANITIFWPVALDSTNNYAVAVSIADPTQFLQIKNFAYLQNGSGIIVCVNNPDSNPHTGTISAVGLPLASSLGLQNQITSIASRLAAIDGIGLTDPTLAVDAVLANQINGLNTTLVSSILKMEQLWTDLQAQFATLQATVNSLTGS